MNLNSKCGKTPKKNDFFWENLLPLHSHQVGDKITGSFNGFTIVCELNEQNLLLNERGSFGKGNLSRNCPKLANKEFVDVLRKRQLKAREVMFGRTEKIAKILLVPDSDSENEDYFNNLKVTYALDATGVKETLNLSLEEAYFLINDLKCLNCYYNKQLFSSQDAWNHFIAADEYFLQNYLVYYYYRSKNWIVKTGIKFGVDFVLYKDGPKYNHSTYAVIIDNLKENMDRKGELNRRSMKIIDLLGLNRLCETVGKKLLVCQIIWPQTFSANYPIDLTTFTIKEVLLRRWLPFKEQD